MGGGACLSGQVAFEMARQLVAAGEEVAKTVIVESYAPGIVAFQPRGFRGRLRRGGMRLVVWLEGSGPGARFVSIWSGVLYGDKVTAKPLLDEPLLRTMKRVRRSNLRALIAYRPPTYPGEVVLFQGERDRQDIANLGWDRFVTGGIELHRISGYHQTVLHEPQVDRLASQVNACLNSTGI